MLGFSLRFEVIRLGFRVRNLGFGVQVGLDLVLGYFIRLGFRVRI